MLDVVQAIDDFVQFKSAAKTQEVRVAAREVAMAEVAVDATVTEEWLETIDRGIFFVDIGPVWDGHEGDAGDTFVVGDDPEMVACAEAARALWHDVSRRWREDGLGGKALYAYAVEQASAAGWRLNLDIKGHRVSDFPHAIYRAGNLGDFADCPNTGLWILEIQIAHPTRDFGAFYEDILVSDAA